MSYLIVDEAEEDLEVSPDPFEEAGIPIRDRMDIPDAASDAGSLCSSKMAKREGKFSKIFHKQIFKREFSRESKAIHEEGEIEIPSLEEVDGQIARTETDECRSSVQDDAQRQVTVTNIVWSAKHICSYLYMCRVALMIKFSHILRQGSEEAFFQNQFLTMFCSWNSLLPLPHIPAFIHVYMCDPAQF